MFSISGKNLRGPLALNPGPGFSHVEWRCSSQPSWAGFHCSNGVMVDMSRHEIFSPGLLSSTMALQCIWVFQHLSAMALAAQRSPHTILCDTIGILDRATRSTQSENFTSLLLSLAPQGTLYCLISIYHQRILTIANVCSDRSSALHVRDQSLSLVWNVAVWGLKGGRATCLVEQENLPGEEP